MTSHKSHEHTPTWGPPPTATGAPSTPTITARVLFDTVVRPSLLQLDPIVAQFHIQQAASDTSELAIPVADYLARIATIAASPWLAIESAAYPGSGGAPRVYAPPVVAWACINAALEDAVLAGRAHVVGALVGVPHWQVCPHTAAKVVNTAVVRSRTPAHLVPILLGGRTQFAPDVLRPVVKELVDSYDVLDHAHRLDVVMASPGCPPAMVWEVVMDAGLRCAEGEGDLHVAAMPHVLRTRSRVVAGDWQFDRARNRARMLSGQVSVPSTVPPRLLAAGCPRLLVDLPVDVQLHVHDLLDLESLRRVRLTSRALREFPVDRFASLRLACALKEQLNGSHQGPGRWRAIQEQFERAGPAGLDCRALLEAVRRLDVEMALKYLYPLPEDEALGYGVGNHSGGCILPWALLTLLHMLDPARSDEERSESDASRIGLLLQAVLGHPLLPSLAWTFVMYSFSSVQKALSSISQGDCALLDARHSNPTAPAQHRVLLDLVRTGTLSATATSLFFTNHDPSNGSDPPPISSMTPLSRIFLFLATLSRNPATFAHILPYLTRPSAPPTSDPLFPHQPFTTTLLTALATHHPSDPARFLTYMLTHLGLHAHQGVAFHVSVRAIARGNPDAVAQLVEGMTDCQLLKSLIMPPFPRGTPPDMQLASAVVLTRWARLTRAELEDMRAKGETVMVQSRSGARKTVDWMELLQVEKWVGEYCEALGRDGRGQAVVRAEELRSAWKLVREMMDEMEKARIESGKGGKSGGSGKQGRRGVNEGGCIFQ